MLKDTIQDDLTTAMKARDAVRTQTLRGVITAVKNAEIDRRTPLDDDAVLEVVAREAKRRRESIEAFGSAGRDDLVAKETAELEILSAYLPAALSDADLAALVDAAVTEAGATSMREMGAVMKILTPQVRGRADGAAVAAAVKARLGG